MASWAARTPPATTLRTQLWNSIGDLGQRVPPYANWGTFPAGTAFGNGTPIDWWPFFETSIKTGWGAGSLGFKLPAGQTCQNACGSFYIDTSTDLATRISVGQRLVITVSTLWDQAMCDLVAAHDGTKLFDLVPQDTSYDPNGNVSSSPPGKFVVQTNPFSLSPIMYRYLNGNTTNLWESDGIYQNGPTMRDTCHYQSPVVAYYYALQAGADETTARAAAAAAQANNVSGCFSVVPNTWMTWNLDVYFGDSIGPFTYGGNTWTTFLNSTIKLYGQADGQSRVLLLDWNPNVPTYIPFETAGTYGKVWLFPYSTNGYLAQPYSGIGNGIQADAHAYYDGLIVSTTLPAEADFIGSPVIGGGVSPTGGVSPDVLLAGSSNVFPRSRVNIG